MRQLRDLSLPNVGSEFVSILHDQALSLGALGPVKARRRARNPLARREPVTFRGIAIIVPVRYEMTDWPLSERPLPGKLPLLAPHQALPIPKRCQDSIRAGRFSDRNTDWTATALQLGQIPKLGHSLDGIEMTLVLRFAILRKRAKPFRYCTA